MKQSSYTIKVNGTGLTLFLHRLPAWGYSVIPEEEISSETGSGVSNGEKVLAYYLASLLGLPVLSIGYRF